MRAIKIDVVLKEIFEIDIDPGLDFLYAKLDCRTIDIVAVNESIDLVLDDEGLIRNTVIGAFELKGMPQAYAGHGLLVGNVMTEQGLEMADLPAEATLENVKALVDFVELDRLPKPGFTITAHDAFPDDPSAPETEE